MAHVGRMLPDLPVRRPLGFLRSPYDLEASVSVRSRYKLHYYRLRYRWRLQSALEHTQLIFVISAAYCRVIQSVFTF